MARPNKKGLDYFPLDVNIFNDEKIAAIGGEFKLKGEIVVIKLLCAIYRNGYYLEWSEINKMNILRTLHDAVSANLLEDIVKRLVRWGFFDESLFNTSGVLTSRNIQECYFSATARRKHVTTKYPYILLTNAKTDVNVCNNPVNVCNNPTQHTFMHAETPQIKVNKSKDNLSISPLTGRNEGYQGRKKEEIHSEETKRNYMGLIQSLEDLKVSSGEAYDIAKLSNYGEIGHPVWKAIIECEESKGRIRMPGKYILSKITQN